MRPHRVLPTQILSQGGKLIDPQEAQMEAFQLFRVCVVAFLNTWGLLCLETFKAYHRISLDVVAGPEELVAL